MTKKKTDIVLKLKDQVVEQPAMSPEVMISQAIDKGLSMDTIERLVALKERMDAAAAKRAYYEAMAAFQSECPIIKKNNPVKNKDKVTGADTTTRYKHETIEDIVQVAGPHMKNNGLSYSLDTTWENGNIVVSCKASHIQGHSEVGKFGVPIDPAKLSQQIIDRANGDDYHQFGENFSRDDIACNHDFDAIAEAYKMLYNHKGTNLVIALSDGKPNCDHCGNREYDQDKHRLSRIRTLIHDNERVAKTIGIGVLYDAEQFPTRILVNDLDELKTKLAEVLKKEIKRT